METVTTLDYERLWKTLLRAGLKDTFSQVRREFFMNIAHEGPRVYVNEGDVMNNMIEESDIFKNRPEFIEYLKLVIREGDKFKHYTYISEDKTLAIEYFANISSGIPKEFVDFIYKDKAEDNYKIDGHCASATATMNQVIETIDEETEEKTVTEVTNEITVHLIIIGENNGSIEPEMYPIIIKHELTHACLYDIKKKIESGYYDSLKTPEYWSDEEIINWKKDIQDVLELLSNNTEENIKFEEFICEFLMYESDGSIKVKNPTIESRVPRTSKPDAKPKVTYRTMTPFDRFQESMELFTDEYINMFGPILEQLRKCYDDYDAFLDEIRM